jgi:hypothetical protein
MNDINDYYPAELSYKTTGELPYASASLEVKKLTEMKWKPNNSRMKKGTPFPQAAWVLHFRSESNLMRS